MCWPHISVLTATTPLRYATICVFGDTWTGVDVGEAQPTADAPVLQGFPEGAAGPILRCKMYWVQGDPADAGSLAKADIAHADAVILGAADSRPPKEVITSTAQLGTPD